jgi:hypothetical protein
VLIENWRQDTQQNDTHPDDTQRNEIQQNVTQMLSIMIDETRHSA